MKYLLMILYMLSKDKGKKSSSKSRNANVTHHQHNKSHIRRQAKNYLQRCVVKISYGNNKQENINFLKNYMQQKNKEYVIDKPKLFSDVEVTEEMLEDYVATASNRFYRIIVSPEKNDVDLVKLARELMKKTEMYLGRRLRWFGALRTNTNHNHVHLIIDGTDKDGHLISKLPKELITTDLRDFSQKLVTAQLGYRTKLEIQEEKEKLCNANRMTKLDKEIEEKEKELLTLIDNRRAFEVDLLSLNQMSKIIVKRRLEYLVKLGLAKKNKEDNFFLEKEWSEKLKASNRHNLFFKARNELETVALENLTLFKQGTKISGVVTKNYKPNWEDIWNGAYIVENNDTGQAWYVPYRGDGTSFDRLVGKKLEIMGNSSLTTEINKVRIIKRNDMEFEEKKQKKITDWTQLFFGLCYNTLMGNRRETGSSLL